MIFTNSTFVDKILCLLLLMRLFALFEPYAQISVRLLSASEQSMYEVETGVRYPNYAAGKWIEPISLSFYTVRSDIAGFTRAALTARKPTVSIAIDTIVVPDSANIHHSISIR